MQLHPLFTKLLDAAKGLSRETHRIKKNVKRDFSLINAEAYLDKVVREIENLEALVPDDSPLATPWTAEDGFVYSAAGIRVADCHCDDQPETDDREHDLAVLIAGAVNQVHPGPPDTPPPPPISDGYSANFNTMLRAASDNNLALVSARRIDGTPVVLVCAMQTNPDRTVTPVPFAVMVDGNPFEMFQDPTADVQ